MRSILVAAAALAVLTASGCDINTAPTKPATVECRCGTPPAAATLPPDMRGSTAYVPPGSYHRTRYRPHGPHSGRHYAGGDAYRWHRSYAERSVFTYDYHSDSHSYYQDGGGDADHGTHDGNGFHPVEQGWIDGYGRSHGGGGMPVDNETGGRSSARLHPWHGYDVDCPDGGPHQR